MDKQRLFENYLTNHYKNTEKTDFADSLEVLQLLRKNKPPLDLNLGRIFSGISKEANILDLGCGYGNFLYFLKTWGYKNVFGIDVSSEEVKLCRELFPQYSIEQADIVEYLSKTKEKFEAIYLSHVLEHIKKDEVFEFLEKIKGAMSDSGYLIIVVPNSSAYFNALATRYGDLTHEIGYSENNILQLLRVAGFSRVSIRNFNGVGTFWLNIVRKFLMTCFELFIQALGYDKQSIHTPSMLVIVQK